MADLEVTRDGGAVWARLNRPQTLNAMLNSMKGDIADALAEAEADREVTAFVLTGAGRGFSSGADLKELASEDSAGRSRLDGLLRIEATHRLIEAMQKSRLVTIAGVNGVAAGGGIGLALGCDLVFAAESASFRFVFAGQGLVPDTGLARTLVAAVGARRARALALTAGAIPAEEALGLGLVDRVVADDRLDESIRGLVAELSDVGAETLAITKRLFADDASRDLAFEAVAQAGALADRGRSS